MAAHRKSGRRGAYPGTVSVRKCAFLLSVKTVAREALAKIDTGCAIATFTADCGESKATRAFSRHPLLGGLVI
jgi:hypothetical protein